MALAETDMTKWIVAPAAIGIVISAIYGLRAVSNIFFGQAKDSFKARLESGQVTDLQPFEKLSACLLIGGLLLTGIFPRIISDDANRELAVLYPYEQSNLTAIESVILPAEADAPKEVAH